MCQTKTVFTRIPVYLSTFSFRFAQSGSSFPLVLRSLFGTLLRSDLVFEYIIANVLSFVCHILGVGGIEAEAVMLGQAISMVVPEVVGYKITGNVDPFITSTDVVLTITKVCYAYCF